jgi:hypothetical protein
VRAPHPTARCEAPYRALRATDQSSDRLRVTARAVDRPIAYAAEKSKHPIQRLPSGRFVQVELIFMWQWRNAVGRKEQGVDVDSETTQYPCERDGLRTSGSALPLDEARRKIPADVAGHGHWLESLILAEILHA